MSAREPLQFKRGDWLAVGLVLALALAVGVLFLPKPVQAGYAEIYLNAEKIKTVPLGRDQCFVITGRYTNEITVQAGSVSITRSNCPGNDCVHSGTIHSTGRSLVCLPNALEIRIVSHSGDVDFVVG